MKKIELCELKPGNIIYENGRLVTVLNLNGRVTFCHMDGDVMNTLSPSDSFDPYDIYLVTTLKEIWEIARELNDES